jgi:hypothetical protein
MLTLLGSQGKIHNLPVKECYHRALREVVYRGRDTHTSAVSTVWTKAYSFLCLFAHMLRLMSHALKIFILLKMTFSLLELHYFLSQCVLHGTSRAQSEMAHPCEGLFHL